MQSRSGFGLAIYDDSCDRPIVPFDGSYFPLSDRSEYCIKLTNDTGSRADATVKVDGKEIGRFRVPAYGDIKIRRPSGTNRALVFVAEKSGIAREAGVSQGRFENGVIQVTFYPEKSIRPVLYDFDDERVYASNNSSRRRGRGESFLAGARLSTMSLPSSLPSASSSSQRRAAAPPPLAAMASSNAMPSFLTASSGSRGLRHESGATILGDSTNQHFSDVSPITDIDWDNVVTLTARLVVRKDDRHWNRNRRPIAISRVPDYVLNTSNSNAPPRIEDWRRNYY